MLGVDLEYHDLLYPCLVGVFGGVGGCLFRFFFPKNLQGDKVVAKYSNVSGATEILGAMLK